MFIYKVTNKINGKVYIGQTVKSVLNRWKSHLSDSKRRDFVFYRAIRKYGSDNFKIEEIDGANSISELNYKEYLYIYKFNTLAPNGYNSTTGGKNFKMTQEIKDKISKANKNKPKSKEHCVNLSKSHIGNKASEESKNKMTVSMTNNVFLSKPIVRNDGMEFPSIAECARQTDTSTGNICMVLNGDRLTANGYHFKRLEDCDKIEPWDIPYPPERAIKRSDGRVFNSINECAAEMKTRNNNISRVLKGYRKSHKGYSFEYLESISE